MRMSLGATLFGALFYAISGFGQVEMRCNAYPVQPVVLTNGSGYFFVEDSGKWRYTAEAFQAWPDRFVDILDLNDEAGSTGWFYHSALRRWSSSPVPAKGFPGWLTIDELKPLVGPIDAPWILYYGRKYLWFQTEGTVETNWGPAEFSLVFSLSSEECGERESCLDVLIWPQWLDINIGEVSIVTDYYTLSIEDRPRGVLHLDFSSPDRALATFSGSHGIFPPQSEQPMTELRGYDSFLGMLTEGFSWLAEKNAQQGWRYNWEFGIREGRDPMRSWGGSPYNELTSDLLVTKAAWRGRDDPEGLEAALEAIEAEYDLSPGELPPSTMRLIAGEIAYFMRPRTR